MRKGNIHITVFSAMVIIAAVVIMMLSGNEQKGAATYVLHASGTGMPDRGMAQRDSSKIMVYPNPVRHTLYVTVPTRTTGVVRLEVFNSSGQPVYRADRQAGRLINIDVQTLSRGSYFLRVTDQKGNRWNTPFIRE
ncbi:MAG TPA: T9SS type A sorting domain-containing protein [Flavisolibacter sp.]